MFDDHKNFAYSTVLVAPVPATSGTALRVQAGESDVFPVPPFNAVAWPDNANPMAGNAEIVRVTAIDGDTDGFTIVRAQEATAAKNIGVGWQIMAAITAKTMQDIEDIVINYVPNTRTVNGHALSSNVTVTKGDVGLGNANNTSDATKQLAFLQAAYPIGSVYINAAVDTNPATLLGFGTWAVIAAGKVLVGLDDGGDTDFDTLAETGGDKQHWHWQTVGADENAIYARKYGTGADPANTKIASADRTFADGLASGVADGRFDGTEYASSLQPYIVVSMWQRTA